MVPQGRPVVYWTRFYSTTVDNSGISAWSEPGSASACLIVSPLFFLTQIMSSSAFVEESPVYFHLTVPSSCNILFFWSVYDSLRHYFQISSSWSSEWSLTSYKSYIPLLPILGSYLMWCHLFIYLYYLFNSTWLQVPWRQRFLLIWFYPQRPGEC